MVIKILLSHFPPYGDVQVTFSRFYWNSKWPPRINFNVLVGAKTQKINLVIFFTFSIIFLAICGCASDFLKMLQKFKMAARSQLKIFLRAQKLWNLTSEIIQILQSHSPQYGDVQVIFSGFFWNSKWPPRINFIFFEVAKTQKNKSYILQILQSHSPRYGDVHVIF